MGQVWSWVIRIFFGACTSAVSQGVLYWLKTRHGIDAPLWVATLLTETEASAMALAPSILWAILGAAGLIGVTAYECFKIFASRLRIVWPSKDCQAWRHVQKLTLWQAAGLWAGEAPVREVPETSPIYSTFQMLKGAAASGRLRVIKRETPISNSYVLQSELSRFAKEIGAEPKFKFAQEQEDGVSRPAFSEEKIKAWDVIHRRWQLLDGGSPEYRLEEAVADFNRAARDGDFSVWGRLDGNSQYESIPPDFWITGGIDMLASMQEAGEGGVAQSRVIARDAKKYIGLRVIASEIETAWPGTFTDNWREVEPWDYK